MRYDNRLKKLENKSNRNIGDEKISIEISHSSGEEFEKSYAVYQAKKTRFN